MSCGLALLMTGLGAQGLMSDGDRQNKLGLVEEAKRLECMA